MYSFSQFVSAPYRSHVESPWIGAGFADLLTMADASNISTHYYKIGHVANVKYWVYHYDTGKVDLGDGDSFNSSDQALLELELSIRFKYPKILLTYYNKALYYFQFSHNPGQLDLAEEYPLILRNSSSISTDIIADPTKASEKKPPKNDNEQEDFKDEESLMFVCISLLKAIKKLLIYELSNHQSINIFGNYIIFRISYNAYHIIYIDSMIITNGDVLFNAIEKIDLELYDPSILSVPDKLSGSSVPINEENELISNFVVYLIPSGIRCHFYDSLKMLNSFTYSPPKNADRIFNLLKLATGIDLSKDKKILWVKLIPNLQHLNNQTSRISRFIHKVENKKFILWPWSLCVLQFGKFEKNIVPKAQEGSSTINDPQIGYMDDIHALETGDYVDSVSLLSDLLDLMISSKDPDDNNVNDVTQEEPGLNEPKIATNIPLDISPLDVGSIEPKNDIELDAVDGMSIDLGDELPNEIFDDDDHDVSSSEYHQPQPRKMYQEDDLFGAGDSDKESDEKSVLHKTLLQNHEITSQGAGLVYELSLGTMIQRNSVSQQIDDFFKQDSFYNRDEFNYEDPFLDIPKDKIAFNGISPYDDPGAPLPMSQTPLANQGLPLPLTTELGINSVNGTLGTYNSIGATNNKDSDENTPRSIFSPIFFNPLIRNSVDNKYGKGGKFYVDKDREVEPLVELPNIRATSVTGYEVRKKVQLDKGLTSDYQYKRVFSDSEDFDPEYYSKQNYNTENYEEEEAEQAEEAAAEEDLEEDREPTEKESDEDEDDLDNIPNIPLDFSFDTGMIPNIVGSSSSNYAFSTFTSNTLKQNQATNQALNMATGYLSPTTTSILPSSKFNIFSRIDSPFDSPMDDKLRLSSPGVGVDNDKLLMSGQINMAMNIATPMPMAMSLSTPVSSGAVNTPGGVSGGIEEEQTTTEVAPTESSNCLPLILRGVNVHTIPSYFLLNNIPGALKISASAADFKMDIDEEEEDFELSKKNEMTIKTSNLDEFLRCLGPNLIFDLGWHDFDAKLISSSPKDELQMEDLEKFESSEVDGRSADSLEGIIKHTLPLSYRVKVDEFVNDLTNYEKIKSENDVNNQLSFLDDIANDEILNPKTKIKKLDEIEWDSFDVSEKNINQFNRYMEVLNDINQSGVFDASDSVWSVGDNKIRLFKNDGNTMEIINLNSIVTNFWQLLYLKPILGEKDIQVLLISEVDRDEARYNRDFLDFLTYFYREGRFGLMEKIHFPSEDENSIEHGLLQFTIDEDDKDTHYMQLYKSINKKLKTLVELIRADSISKTNKLSLDKPLLLIFVNFNAKFNSLLEIGKISRNFSMLLKLHQLPLQVFVKIIPAQFFIKTFQQIPIMKTTSTFKFTKLAMSLYNQCPSKPTNTIFNVDTNQLFTHVVKETGSKIHFKLIHIPSLKTDNEEAYDDAFLHVAYERSIDKTWFSVAWSDPLGIVTFTKTWCCMPSLLSGNTQRKDVYDLKTITDEIFKISNVLFKKLNEEIIKRTNGLGAKKFMILTRINSVIPDDELIHWKRLSMKFKDILLVVLSVNSSAKVLFKDIEERLDDPIVEPTFEPTIIVDIDGPEESLDSEEPLIDINDGDDNKDKDLFVPSPSYPSQFGDTPTYISPGSNFISPGAEFNFNSTPFLSPDTEESNNANDGASESPNEVKPDLSHLIIQDRLPAITAIIPKSQVPSFNCPTRVGMKLGLLIKKINTGYLVFEISLLSCSNYWGLTPLMKLILNHYKKLITLSEIMGINDSNTSPNLIPWHIQAVSKTLRYLVHIDVED